MKKMLALVLALAMCLGCAALAEETALVYALGAPMPDFTFTDINGVSHTLSETLKEKEMVLIVNRSSPSWRKPMSSTRTRWKSLR